MNEEFEKEFAKLSEKDKREVNNLIRFMQEKKYHDEQYEELLNQYIELSRDYEYLQSKIDKAIEYINDLCKCSDGTYFNYGDDLSPKHIVDILKEDK